MLADLLPLAAALALLTLGAELLVRGASTLARRAGISSFVVGLTIVGFGTSTPELATSVVAALRGQGDIAVGNVVGSNIFNIAVVLGLTAVICPVPVKLEIVRRETWIVIAVALLPFSALATGNEVGRPAGALMLAGLVVYVAVGYLAGREPAAPGVDVEPAGAIARGWQARVDVCVASIAAGLALLVWGSSLLVSSASSIARELGFSELAIGLTIVAAGTSAPELVTSLVAALRRQTDLAIGNVLGSNVFNVLGILGFTSVVRPQEIRPQTFWLDLPVMLACSLALLPIVSSEHRISRAEGAALLVAFAVYTTLLLTVAPGWFARG